MVTTEIKSAKDILREMEVSFTLQHKMDYRGEPDEWFVDTEEDHVVNAMIVYVNQFIEAAAELATSKYPNHNKQAILELKELQKLIK